MNKQLLYTRMREEGLARYRRRREAAEKHAAVARTTPGRIALTGAANKLVPHVEEWKKGLKRRHAKLENYYPLVEGLDPAVIALLVCKTILDQINQRSSLAKLAFAVGRRLEDEERFNNFKRQKPQLFAAMKELNSIKGYRHFREAIHGRERKDEEVTPLETWPMRWKHQIGLELVHIFIQETHLVELVTRTTSHTGRVRAKHFVHPTEKTIDWIEQSHAANEGLTPNYLPMVSLPMKWQGIWGGGYDTDEIRGAPIVKTYRSDYSEGMLESLEQAELEHVLTCVNELQEVAWQVNVPVFVTIDHFFEHDWELADLPPKHDEELPPMIETDDVEEKREWKKRAVMVRRRNLRSRSRRMQTLRTINLARDYIDYGRFWYPYQLDFRGRAYVVPYYLQPQGPSYSRGLLEFADKFPIETDAQEGWLQVHGANCWGEKGTFDDRRQWVAQHEDEVRLTCQDPIEHQWWTRADKPWEFLAWCLDYGCYLEDGSAHQSGLPVSMDGTQNGMQILSLLTGDRELATATNVLPSPEPQDFYQAVADVVTEQLRASQEEMALDWLNLFSGQVRRDVCKRPVMIFPYNGTVFAAREYTIDWYNDQKLDVFPNGGIQHCVFLSNLIWAAIKDRCVGGAAVMQWLSQCARTFVQWQEPICWTTPSGWHVTQAYEDYELKCIRSQWHDKVVSLEYAESCKFSLAERKNLDALAPNYIHSIDASIVHLVVARGKELGIRNWAMVHDSYGTTAHHAPEVARLIREVYAEVFSQPLLEQWRQEASLRLPSNVKLPDPPEWMGGFDVSDIINSNYAFH